MVAPPKAPAKMPTSVIPTCTVERKRLGVLARESAVPAPLLPASAIWRRRARRAETTANSAMAKTPLRRISSRTMLKLKTTLDIYVSLKIGFFWPGATRTGAVRSGKAPEVECDIGLETSSSASDNVVKRRRVSAPDADCGRGPNPGLINLYHSGADAVCHPGCLSSCRFSSCSVWASVREECTDHPVSCTRQPAMFAAPACGSGGKERHPASGREAHLYSCGRSLPEGSICRSHRFVHKEKGPSR